MIEKEFVPYEEALALKELGFDEPCNTCYDKLEMVASYGVNAFDYKNYNTSGYIVSRPTFSQAFRWFRDNFGLYWPIMSKVTPSNNLVYYIYHGRLREDWNGCFESYEEVEIACLRKLIEIIKN
jgi:hypothetical protein